MVQRINGFTATWAALLILLASHLCLNYAAVRSVQMTSLNRQRANIAFSALLDSDPDLDLDDLRSGEVSNSTRRETPRTQDWKILTPAQVAQQEHIFHRDGDLQWTSSTAKKNLHLGQAMIGISIPTFFQSTIHYQTGYTLSNQTSIPLQQLTTLFSNEAYIVYLNPLSPKNQKCWHACILLKSNCTVKSQLKAWMHALLAARVLSESTLPSQPTASDHLKNQNPPDQIFNTISSTLSFLNQNSRFESYANELSNAGWSLDIAALETKAGRRISFTSSPISQKPHRS